MPLHVATRRHGHRDRAQQHRDQARQAEEAPRAIQRVLDLRARLVDVEQPLAALLGRLEPRLEGLDLAPLAGEQQREARAAAGRDQLRRRKVRVVDQDARREILERPALVRPRDQHLPDAESTRTDRQLVADPRAERRQQLRVRPGLARLRPTLDRARRPEGLARHRRAAPQRIVVADRAHVGQLAQLLAEHHAQHRGGARHAQSTAPRRIGVTRAERRRRLEPQVRRQHLGGLAVDRERDPIDEEADAGQRRDRDRQREQQHAELAGLPLPAEHPHRQLQRAHHGFRPVARLPSRACGRSAMRVRDRASRGPPSCAHSSSSRTAAASPAHR